MSYSKPALDFIQRSANLLNWGSGNNSLVMDIGCGDGTNSTRYLIECLPEMIKLVAIDSNPYSIFDAVKRSPYKKIDYSIADIEQRDTLTQWLGRMDKIFSNHCLSLTKDQNKALQNVYSLLVPGGSAALSFILQAPLYDWMIEMFERWRQFNFDGLELRVPQSHAEGWSASYYEESLRNLGFKVILCEKEIHDYRQEIGDACKDYLFRMCPLSPMIPEKQIKAFREDMYSTFLRQCCRDDEGVVFAVMSVLNVLLKKPSR